MERHTTVQYGISCPPVDAEGVTCGEPKSMLTGTFKVEQDIVASINIILRNHRVMPKVCVSFGNKTSINERSVHPEIQDQKQIELSSYYLKSVLVLF